jgi:small ligand-binding sensory domain FIST
MSADCGVGVSCAPDGAIAAREAVAAAIDRLEGAPCAAVVVCASVAHKDPRRIVSSAVDAAGDARVVGCSASGVLTGEGEIEEGPAIAALALGASWDARPFAFAGDDAAPVMARATAKLKRGLVALFADGYSAHPDRLAASLAGALARDTSLVGGLAIGPAGVAPAYRWLDGEISAHGAAGIALRTNTAPIVGVAQGCAPVGAAHVVTRAQGNVVAELDGRPAFEAFAQVARPFLDDLPRASQSVFLAVPADPEQPDGAFVVRGLLRFDPERGLLATSEPLVQGSRVRFALRSSVAARDDLHRMVDDVKARLAGRRPRLGLYFECAGRGASLQRMKNLDTSLIQGALGPFPLFGMFGGGELGPSSTAAGGARLHLFAGVLAVIPDHDD